MARTLVITPVTHIYITIGKTATASATFTQFLEISEKTQVTMTYIFSCAVELKLDDIYTPFLVAGKYH